MQIEDASGPGVGRSRFVAVSAILLAALAVASHEAVASRFYGGLSIPQGTGMTHPTPEELTALLLFAIFGGAAALALAVALRASGLAARLLALPGLVVGREALVLALCAAAVFVVSLWTGQRVLGGAATTDDEHAYQFIGRTLATGHLTAPSPGTDLSFYREQFIILTSTARYGKYPIGHPLLLALGDLAGLEPLVVPAVTTLMVIGVFLVARQVSSAAAAVAAALLCVSSPQVLMSGGTLLSQPASAACAVAAVWAYLCAARDLRPVPWMLACGAALGFGLLVRPLPGVLFVLVLAAHAAWEGRSAPARARLVRLLALLGPVVAAGLVLLAVNRAQTGEAFTSGYQTFHAAPSGPTGLFGMLRGDLAELSMSVVASVLRLNFWLFGWPLSFLLLPFARRRGPFALPWLMVGAVVAYRLIAPKGGVSGTGPVYMYEAIPFLAVLSADGARELALRGLAVGTRRVGALGTASAIAGSALAGALLFFPGRTLDLERMGAAQRIAPDLARARSGGRPALVFHEGTVPYWTRLSWAYYPPTNPPGLDGPVLYLLAARSPEGDLGPSVDFWKRRYPDRSAWFFSWPPGGPPELLALESLVRPALPGAGDAAP